MSTFEHARRLGACAILTDGKRRYSVSDWSAATGEVYGHAETSQGWGEYGRLPGNLTVDESPRFRVEGTYADGICQLFGPQYGEPEDIAQKRGAALFNVHPDMRDNWRLVPVGKENS